jgi:hypothetical protein
VISADLPSVAALPATFAASFGDGIAAIVAGAEASRACGEAVQYHIATIKPAETTVATIRPSALRMLTLPYTYKLPEPGEPPGN